MCSVVKQIHLSFPSLCEGARLLDGRGSQETADGPKV